MTNKTPNSRETYLRLLKFVRPYTRQFAVGIVAMVALGLSDAAIPALLKPLLDGGFIEKDLGSIQKMLGLLVVLFLVRGVANIASSGAMGWVGGKVVYDIRKAMFGKLLNLPTRYYDNTTTGNTISKVTYNVTAVTSAATQTVTILIRDTVTVLSLLGVALYLNWALTLTIFIALPPVIIVAQLFAKRMRRFSHSHQDAIGDMTHVLEESVRGHRIIKIFHGEEQEKGRFFKIANRVRQFQQKVILAGAGNVAVVEWFTSMVLAVIIYIGIFQAIEQGQTPGHLIAFFAALGLLISPAKRLASAMQPLQRGLAAAESVFLLLGEDIEKDTGNRTIENAQGALEFDHVRFSYQEDKGLALNGLSFTAQAGETIALVGHSGSGKSTVASLIPRFYDIEMGEIRLDGVNTKELTLADLRSHISHVGQEVVLFNDTISANIAYGMDPQPPKEMIHEAASKAHALEFIDQLPAGFDTLVGENGVQLSGGQRQRLAIARALLKNAPLLILDEATSALDSKSETHVQAAIDAARQGRTTIIIAHRLSTVENADRILVMEKGEVVEQGTHTELLEKRGVYANLYGKPH